MKDTLMTVKQLVDVLQSFPADLPVLVSGYESGYDQFYFPEIRDLVRKPENMYYDGEYQLPDHNESAELSALVLERVYRDDRVEKTKNR